MLQASAAPGLPGPGTSAGRAGQEGTKAARLREGARRGEERAQPEQPGAEAAGERASEWEVREGRGVGGAGLEREEGGERVPKTGC